MRFPFNAVRQRSKLSSLRFRPSLEGLEDRAVPTVLSGEVHVNTLTAGGQNHSDTATNAAGRTVTVWVRDYGAYQHLRAQQFNLAGQKIGGEIFVASTAVRRSNPHVAISNAGAIVVTWEEASTVKAQRLNSNGVLLGAPIVFNLAGKTERSPDVGISNNGDFVVAYDAVSPPAVFGLTSRSSVVATMFRANGSPVKSFYVSADTGFGGEVGVARAPDGRFAIVFGSFFFDPNNPIPEPQQFGTGLRRYSAAGVLLSSHRIGTAAASFGMEAKVAMDNAGNSLVVFHDSQPQVMGDFEYVSGADLGVRAVRVSRTGSQGSPINLLAPGAALDAAAIDRTNGSFVVVHSAAVAGGQTQLSVAEFGANGALRRNTVLGRGRFDGSVGVSDSHYFFVTYTANNLAGDPFNGVFARRGIISPPLP